MSSERGGGPCWRCRRTLPCTTFRPTIAGSSRMARRRRQSHAVFSCGITDFPHIGIRWSKIHFGGALDGNCPSMTAIRSLVRSLAVSPSKWPTRLTSWPEPMVVGLGPPATGRSEVSEASRNRSTKPGGTGAGRSPRITSERIPGVLLTDCQRCALRSIATNRWS